MGSCRERMLAAVAAAGLAACGGAARERRAEPALPAGEARTTAAAPAEDRIARGEAALRTNRFAEAEAAFAAAAAAAPRDARPLVGLARARLGLGRRDDAVADLGRALAIADSAEARALRGRYLLQARRFDEATSDLERAVELAPGDGSAWAALAVAQVNRGDDVEAAHAFAAAARTLGSVKGADVAWTLLLATPPDPIAPQESLDRCTRGRIAMLEGRWVDAHAEHLNALRYAPRWQWCLAGLAEVTFRLGDARGAERLLGDAVATFPERLPLARADAQGKLAAVVLASGRAEEAVRLARAALAARPGRAALLDVLARACDRAGDAACAGEAYAALLARPHLPDAMRAHAEERRTALAAAR